MGTSRIADAVTGQVVMDDEEVVAVVIDRRTGGFPDATTHSVMPAIGACEMFEPVSLPIRGRVDDYGRLVPHPDQVSASMMLDLANLPDWETFSDRAFGVEGAVTLGKGAHGVQGPSGGPDDSSRKRPLGLAFYRAATWETLLGLSRHKSRTKDVSMVLGVMDEVRQAARTDPDVKFNNAGLFRLRQSRAYGIPGGDVDMPRLARAFEGREGGDTMGSAAIAWISRARGGPLGYSLFDGLAGKSTFDLLGGLWDLQAAEDGLRALGRTYLPSNSIGQRDNALDVMEMAVTSLEAVGRSVQVRAADMGEIRETPRLEALLSRMDVLRGELTAEMERVQDGPSGYGR